MSGECQWCGAASRPGATHCNACGAALALEQDLAGMVIPGVTEVDPEIARYRDKPLKIPRGTVSEYAATNAVGVASADPTGILALGTLAAVVARESQLLGSGGKQIDPQKVGVPSEAVLEVARRLQEAQAKGETTAPTDEPGGVEDDREPPAMEAS